MLVSLEKPARMETLNRTVRPLLTIAFAATLVYMALTGRISADFIQGLAAGVINFWFAEKSALSTSTHSL